MPPTPSGNSKSDTEPETSSTFCQPWSRTRARALEHPLGDIDPDNLAIRANRLLQKVEVETGPAPDFDDRVAGAQLQPGNRHTAPFADRHANGLEYVVADLGTLAGCETAVAETVKRLGPIEILVCNQGLGSAHERVIWEQTPELWRRTMQINLDGPFYLSRFVMQQMIQAGYGRIVYVSSTSAIIAEHAGSAYNTPKAGLLGLMPSAAVDGGAHGITANAVLPGWVRTEMAERSARAEAERRGITPEQVWEERAALYPSGNVATPEEVAQGGLS